MDHHELKSNFLHRQTFGNLTSAQWLQVLVRSLSHSTVEGVPMPGFPPETYQTATHGTCGPNALKEAGRFFALVESHARAAGRPIHASTRVLDFGCGWGRMLRLFLNRVDSQNLFGADVRPESVTLAQELNPFSRFTTVSGLPPSPFEDCSFDLVIAYSVFSHLSEQVSRAWIQEIARVLQPGGLAILTTQGSDFLDFVESLSTKPIRWRWRMRLAKWRGRPRNELWLRLLQEGFNDIASARQLLANGRFVHVSTGGGSGLEASQYGESIIPRAYVEREWTDLKLIDFIDERRQLAQALIVLQKPL